MRNTGYSNTPIESAPISLRENKMNELRERIKQKHQSVNTHVSQTNQLAADVYNIISQPTSNPIQISNPIEQIENKVIESVMPNDEKQKINLVNGYKFYRVTLPATSKIKSNQSAKFVRRIHCLNH
jgi:hypothetical protein